MNNPFEGKAVRFETSEQLDHLAELARGYGLDVGSINEHTKGVGYFRLTSNLAFDYYTNCYTANNLHEIHYFDFVMNIEAVKGSEIEVDYEKSVRNVYPDAKTHKSLDGWTILFGEYATDIYPNLKDAWRSAYKMMQPTPNHIEQVLEMVNHPKHYNVKGFEVIDIIDAFGLNFNMGNALKYLLRAGRKGNKKQDIEKAIWYLQRENKTN